VQGFDYDFTLTRYSQEMQALIYSMALQHMVHDLKYPHAMELALKYDPSFAIVGLAIDMEKALLCKVSYINR
jgi:5' nucleotidase family